MSNRLYISADEAIALLTALHADKETIDKVRSQQIWDQPREGELPGSWAGSDIPDQTRYVVRYYGGSL